MLNSSAPMHSQVGGGGGRGRSAGQTGTMQAVSRFDIELRAAVATTST